MEDEHRLLEWVQAECLLDQDGQPIESDAEVDGLAMQIDLQVRVEAEHRMVVRTFTWTGLCRKSKTLSVFDGAERAEGDLDPLLVVPAYVGINHLALAMIYLAWCMDNSGGLFSVALVS